MLITRWFFPCVLLLVQNAIGRDLKQDESNVNENTSTELQNEFKSYEYHHPPVPTSSGEEESRKGKSLIVDEKKSSLSGVRRKIRPQADQLSLEIPVQVIYDTEPNPVPSPVPHQTMTSPSITTRRVVRRRQRTQTKNKEEVSVADDDSSSSTSTEIPKRSRGSYFKKRTETPSPKVKILEEKNFVYAHSGNFHYSFLGADGTKVSSEGSLKSYDNNKTGEAVSGSVFYKDNDGNDFSLTYTADENGYRPVGAHLPTPPPLPPAIARALKYIAENSTPSPLSKSDQ